MAAASQPFVFKGPPPEPTGYYGEHARPLVELGYDVTPVNGKAPILPGWQKRPECALNFGAYNGAGVGIVAGGAHNVIALDIDILDRNAVNVLRDLALDHLGFAPERIGKAPKTMLVYRCTEPIRKLKTGVYDIYGVDAAVEVLAEGQQFVAFGLHPDTGQPYSWPNDSLEDFPVDKLPLIGPDGIKWFLERAEATLAEYGTPKAKSRSSGGGDKQLTPPLTEHAKIFKVREHSQQSWPEEIEAAVSAIPNNDCHYDDWVRMAHAVKGAQKGMTADGGNALFFKWSRKSAKNDDTATLGLWNSITEVREIGAGTIFDWAKDYGFDIGQWRTEHSPMAQITPSGDLILDPADPLATARTILEREFTENGLRTLHHQSGEFRNWVNNHYPVADSDDIRAIGYRVLDDAMRPTKEGLTPFQPTAGKVNNAIDALKAAANLNSATTAPAWLDGSSDPNPRQILAMKNGLLNIAGRQLMAPSPLFWTFNALNYVYKPNAGCCEEWLKFLDSIWNEDQASIEVLQEIFGYLLTGDTRQQKAFLLVGPKRSGKGTIARLLTALLGSNNVCAPTLASLSSQFGLAPLIDKLVAIIADARLGSRADQHQIAERLLSVSGEDGQTIDRKYLPPWNGRLPTRFFVMSNELPRLADASGALASRFIILQMTRSFYGKEDQGLTERLLGELPAILNWALDGRDRLAKRGHFQQPESSVEAMQELEDLSSPTGAFVRDRLEVGPLHEESIDAVYCAWNQWCEDQGRDYPGTKATFSRDLRAAVAGLETKQKRLGGGRPRFFVGVRLI